MEWISNVSIESACLCECVSECVFVCVYVSPVGEDVTRSKAAATTTMRLEMSVTRDLLQAKSCRKKLIH
jgi:hypothetical protein